MASESDKEALAREFIRMALLPEYQQALAETGYLSVRSDIMEAQFRGEIIDKAMEEPLDETLAEQYRQLVSQPLVFIGYNEAISTTIAEEGSAYFAARCTVEEVAARIQNRVALYLAEIA